MILTNLIDLIAEVAAKRTAREGKTEEDTPEQARADLPPIPAIFGRFHGFFAFRS